MINDPETPEVGVISIDDEHVVWRVWASRASEAFLILDPGGRSEQVQMEATGRGYFAVETSRPQTGARYAYVLDGGPPLPDPCSRWQPDGVEAPSAYFDPGRFAWDEGAWSGVAREDLVFYELHVGTFTPEGTFDAVIPRLDALRELGITVVELMPVGQFAGIRGWGYDGVHPFAPQHSYGGPEALQRLVRACHLRGLAVALDVVYNHFGPEGNVFPDFGEYLTERYKTDWGPALNYDGRGSDAVRSMVQQNVRMWIKDYHIDVLRFDAADQIYDRGPSPILSELAEVAHEEGRRRGRPVFTFAETDLNDAPRFLHPADRGGYGFDGHWNDDFHHAVHNVLTGESNGYYLDFTAGPKAVAKVLEEVFVNNGNYSAFRGRRHGTPAKEFSGHQFVAFTQNHDQVGNRLLSDRYAASLPPPALRLAAGLLMTSPRLPLLFMGEEYGETNPFPFFCDFRDPALVDAVRKGRKAEFAHFGWDAEIPDPVAASTRDEAVLSWNWEKPDRAGLRRLYADLLRLRRTIPALRDDCHPIVVLHHSGGSVLEMQRGGADRGGSCTVVFNLSSELLSLPTSFANQTPILRSELPEYGGVLADESEESHRLKPYEFAMFGTVLL